ncbi:GNAT family N-acetyltransferase [Streptomyces sp. SID7909]|uniref:GNAT family N-acetyltransferase n=1 Tax=Streptomyces sp. SID7909 TaxID=2706092 RepID=UPI0013B722BC|nr:GNAT family N-acetyltransferase [Streptomyces sp. SID7909]
MSEVLVRLREDADLGAAAAVLAGVHESDGYPVEGVAEPEAWLSPEGLLAAWVAELDGRVVGHVAVNRARHGEDVARLWGERGGAGDAEVAVLARFFVGRDARGASAGARLMGAAEGYARAHGLPLVLEVLTKDAAAIRLYERLGWQRIGGLRHFFAGRHFDALCFVAPSA